MRRMNREIDQELNFESCVDEKGDEDDEDDEFSCNSNESPVEWKEFSPENGPPRQQYFQDEKHTINTGFEAIPMHKPDRSSKRPHHEDDAKSSISSKTCTLDDERKPQDQTESDVKNEHQIGTKAVLRVHKARVKTLTSQLKSTMESKREGEKMIIELKKKLKTETEQRKKIQKAAADKRAENQRQKVKDEDIGTRMEELKKLLNEKERDILAGQTSAKKTEMEQKGRDVRLSRALEECEKYKKSILQAEENTRECGVEVRRDRDKLMNHIKTLERQRSDILIAFQKQMKLIDVLKRQKAHLEASKLLTFTEEEFLKVLEWGEE